MMQTIKHSYYGLTFLVRLNWDRLISSGALLLALLLGTWLASQIGYYPIVERV